MDTYCELSIKQNGDEFTVTRDWYSPIASFSETELYRTPRFAYYDLKRLFSEYDVKFASKDAIRTLFNVCDKAVEGNAGRWEVHSFIADLLAKYSGTN